MMTTHRLTFLIGGSDAYEVMADEFLAAAGGPAARIALLLPDEERLALRLEHYGEPWVRRSVTSVHPLFPRPDGLLDPARTQEVLQAATGIFIGGGDTPIYQRLYATGLAATRLRERYEQGMPVAGVSAGAMVMMQHCVIEAMESPDKTLQVVPGLSLVRDLIIGVHYTEQNALPGIVEAMALTRTKRGLGIDDGACAVFDNGRFVHPLGRAFYDVEMKDFEQRLYTCTERALKRPPSNV